MTGNTDQEGRITLGLITSWLLGILFVLAGMAAFTGPKAGGAGSGVPFLLLALLLLPPIRRFIYKKTGKSLSAGARIVFALVLMAIALMPSASQVTSNSVTVPATQSQQPVIPIARSVAGCVGDCEQAATSVRQQPLYDGQPLANAQPENVPGDFVKTLFGRDSTNLQRENARERIKGKVVQWSLAVSDIRRSEGDTYEIQTKIAGFDWVSVVVMITARNEHDRQFLASLKIGDPFTFKGVIKTFTDVFSLSSVEIKPAILMSIVPPSLPSSSTAVVPSTNATAVPVSADDFLRQTSKQQ